MKISEIRKKLDEIESEIGDIDAVLGYGIEEFFAFEASRIIDYKL